MYRSRNGELNTIAAPDDGEDIDEEAVMLAEYFPTRAFRAECDGLAGAVGTIPIDVIADATGEGSSAGAGVGGEDDDGETAPEGMHLTVPAEALAAALCGAHVRTFLVHLASAAASGDGAFGPVGGFSSSGAESSGVLDRLRAVAFRSGYGAAVEAVMKHTGGEDVMMGYGDCDDGDADSCDDDDNCDDAGAFDRSGDLGTPTTVGPRHSLHSAFAFEERVLGGHVAALAASVADLSNGGSVAAAAALGKKRRGGFAAGGRTTVLRRRAQRGAGGKRSRGRGRGSGDAKPKLEVSDEACMLADALATLVRLDLDDAEPSLVADNNDAEGGTAPAASARGYNIKANSSSHGNQSHDFYRDAAISEVALLAPPLHGLLVRVAALLREWPGQAALLGVARVAERLLRLPARAPLGAALVGVEVLLRRAHDWEQIASRAVSIAPELARISSLVARWRRLELHSWRAILRSRELASVRTARRWWIHLYSIINGTDAAEALDVSHAIVSESTGGEQRVAASGTGTATAVTEPTSAFEAVTSHPWPTLHASNPAWLLDGLPGIPAADASRASRDGSVVELTATEEQSEHALFELLDEFARTSSVGEYTTRVLLLRAFASELACEDTLNRASDASHHSRVVNADETRQQQRRRRLAALLRSLWRYHAQFVPLVQRRHDANARAPVERKLSGEVALAKWDERSYYSLAESADKSHRRLLKLMREYDDALGVGVAPILDASLAAGVRDSSASSGGSDATLPPAPRAVFSEVFRLEPDQPYGDAPDAGTGGDAAKAVRFAGADGADAEGEGEGATSVEAETSAAATRGTAPPADAPDKAKADIDTDPHAADDAMSRVPHAASVKMAMSTPPAMLDPLSPAAIAKLNLPPMIESLLTTLPTEHAKYAARLKPLGAKVRAHLARALSLQAHRSSAVSVERLTSSDDASPTAAVVGARGAEELCDAIFSRMHSLRTSGAPRQAKERAVHDLLSELRDQGLKPAHSAVPTQARAAREVLALASPPPQIVGLGPGVGHVGHLGHLSDDSGGGEDGEGGDDDDDGNDDDRGPGADTATPGIGIGMSRTQDGGLSEAQVAVQTLWERADTYHQRNLAEMSQLRTEAVMGSRQSVRGAPSRSPDVSARDAATMVGLTEHVSLLALQQRAALGALLSDRQSLGSVVAALDRLAHSLLVQQRKDGERESRKRAQPGAEKQQYTRSEDHEISRPSRSAVLVRNAIARQARGLSVAAESLEQLRMLADAVAAARPGAGRCIRTESLDGDDIADVAPVLDPTACAAAATACADAAAAIRDARRRLETFAPSETFAAASLHDGALGARATAAVLLPVCASAELEQSAAVARAAYESVSRQWGVVRTTTHSGDHDDDADAETTGVGAQGDSNGTRKVGGTRSQLQLPSALPHSTRGTPLRAEIAAPVLRHLQTIATVMTVTTVTTPDRSDVGIGSDQASIELSAASVKQIETFWPLLSGVVEAALLCTQSITASHAPRVPPTSSAPATGVVADNEDEKDDEDDEDVPLLSAHHSAFDDLRRLRLWRVTDAVRLLHLHISEWSEASVDDDDDEDSADSVRTATTAVRGVLVALCADVRALLQPLLVAADACVLDHTALLKGTAKLQYVLSRVFRTLLSRGLCSPNLREDKKPSGSGDTNEDGMSGAADDKGGADAPEGNDDACGMGDAPLSGGEKDVSEQIEDEEQLLGLKSDENENQKDEKKPNEDELSKDEADQGVEMENDFSGDLFDVPEESQNEGKGGDEGDEEDGEEELDREMGEAGDDAEAVDEKMWGDDDDDDAGKDNGEPEKESDDPGQRLDGAPLEEDAIRGKDDDAAPADDKDQKKDDASKQNSADDKAAAEAEGQGEGDGDEGDEGDGTKEGEGEESEQALPDEPPAGAEAGRDQGKADDAEAEAEAMELDDPDANDVMEEPDGAGEDGAGPDAPPENQEDAQAKADEAEIDLSGDLSLDRGDGADDEDGEGEADTDAHGGDAMDQSDDEGAGNNDDDDSNDEDSAQPLRDPDTKDQAAADASGGADAGGDGMGEGGADAAKEEEEDSAMDEAPKAMAALGAGGGNSSGEGGVGDDGDDEEKKAEEEETGKPSVPDTEPNAAEGAAGESGGDGGDAGANDDEDVDDVERDERDLNQDDADDIGEQDASRDAGRDGAGVDPELRMDDAVDESDERRASQPRRLEAPNPFAAPGDATEHWHRRLDMLKRKDSPNQASTDGAAADTDRGEGKASASQLKDGVDMQSAGGGGEGGADADDDAGGGSGAQGATSDETGGGAGGPAGSGNAHSQFEFAERGEASTTQVLGGIKEEADVEELPKAGPEGEGGTGGGAAAGTGTEATDDGGDDGDLDASMSDAIATDDATIGDTAAADSERDGPVFADDGEDDGADEVGLSAEATQPEKLTREEKARERAQRKRDEEESARTRENACNPDVVDDDDNGNDEAEGQPNEPATRHAQIATELGALSRDKSTRSLAEELVDLPLPQDLELERSAGRTHGDDAGDDGDDDDDEDDASGGPGPTNLENLVEREQAARLLWARYKALTAPLAARLCEQLRLVLAPTIATRLGGDYRTGKRINMRRVVAYVASGFRQDRIWLRRTRPARRAYQVTSRHFLVMEPRVTSSPHAWHPCVAAISWRRRRMHGARFRFHITMCRHMRGVSSDPCL